VAKEDHNKTCKKSLFAGVATSDALEAISEKREANVDSRDFEEGDGEGVREGEGEGEGQVVESIAP